MAKAIIFERPGGPNVLKYKDINVKKPGYGEIYNAGGGRYSNCSVIEALNIVEKVSKIKIKRKILKENRVGDHIWYISNMKKFKKRYPGWKQKYSTKRIIGELINEFSQ